MNFKDFYNPKTVYDGFFETYFIRPFIHHYADFKGKESSSSCFKSLLAWLVITLGVAGILMGQIGLLGPEVGFELLYIIGILWLVLSLLPILALFVRLTNGAPQKNKKPRMLGIDTMLGVSCLLFFMLGLLMMTTTLGSGKLDPNANMTNEVDTTDFEQDYVTEEPIFTYQDGAQSQVSNDSLNDLNESDVMSPDESFDPSISTPDPTVEDSLL